MSYQVADKQLIGSKTVMAANLPYKEIVDKLLRYETAIERQLYRAVNQLGRLQRTRQGDAVPPPFNVELSGSD